MLETKMTFGVDHTVPSSITIISGNKNRSFPVYKTQYLYKSFRAFGVFRGPTAF